jgi:hypothetical protein
MHPGMQPGPGGQAGPEMSPGAVPIANQSPAEPLDDTADITAPLR